MERKLGISTLMVLLVIGLFVIAGTASGSDIDIVIPIETRIHALEGSETLVGGPVETGDLAGLECEVKATAQNQDSVHLGNNLLVKSNGSAVVLEGVEDSANAVIEAEGTLVLGEEVVVVLVMGPDEVFSAGITVLIDCAETTTTTTSTTTSTTSTTSTSSTTSTTSSTSTTTSTLPPETVPTTGGCEGGTLNPACLPNTGAETEQKINVGEGLGLFGVVLLLASLFFKKEDAV